MGSGDRFEYGKNDGFAIGFSISRFPFALTIHINVAFWFVSFGFGKAYDE